ncbi:hypothetical protein CTEN210_05234 [Chaetoceros tenuissimus]|uniref:PDZ domain-containing protein n=1 Tax=Chaetoceros tenuissimus TaxID=426638 RepID=A0AAD3CMM2_9STRA|nr:hypothetical protein CTEN210_05234 [Chaetoceros tenuissimus]
MKLTLATVLFFSTSAQVSAFVPVGSVTTNSKLPRADVTITYSTKLEFHSFEEKSSEEHVRSLLKKCTSTVAALVTASVLCLPVNPGAQVQIPSFMEPIVGTHPAYAAVTSLDESDRKEEALRRSTVIDEAWTLVKKYYIDNTFNNQDWDEVREKYESRLKVEKDGAYDDEEAMKLTTAMVKSLGDKYSRVLDRAGYSRIQKFDLIGVGATLMPDSNKRIMVGAPPVKGSEAEKAGIKIGDYIVAVNGVETKGRTAFDIIDQISEQPNVEEVTFTVLTQGPDDLEGEGYIRDVTMKRQFVEVKDPITYKITEKRKDGTIVGYIRISEFNSLVKPKLENALKALTVEGANALVLDLRQNPGGAFQSAVEIAGLFMEDKIATNVVDANQVEMAFRTTKGKVLVNQNTPIVIWLDGGSASASEVLAGSLHDQCKSIIMGSNSFGKGLIQAVYGLKNGSGLVLTVAKYVTPNGTDIQGHGITPDIEAKLPTPLVIGLSTDTSKVDFQKVAMKLSTCTCPSE